MISNRYRMNSELKNLYDQVLKDRTTVLQEVYVLTEQQYRSNPRPGKWSISQILTHVLTSEQLSLGYMMKKAKGIDAVGNSGILESIKMWLLKVSQRMPINYSAPKVVVANTPEALSKEALRQKWLQHLHDLNAFLETIDDKNIRKKIYKHPVAGRLDARQALQFFQEHFHHHMPQIWRCVQ